ncbi:MAG: hypothetical protein GX677_10430 [Treponema sp.]|jgi:hypothetical protein|nr:hypothetical protein [Treponema sp.]
MENQKIKEILIDIKNTNIDFTVIQTGKESKRVNGFYKPDTHEIFLHNLNFKSDNQLVYTAIHEYTHHLITEEKSLIVPSGVIPNSKVHTQEFWAKFGELLNIAEEKHYYSLGLENAPELKALTEDIKTNYLAKNGELMQEFGKKLSQAYDLCKEADIRYEDYIDRILCLTRNTAKDLRKISSVNVNPAIGFDNMKIVASAKKGDERNNIEKEFLDGKKSPSTVREMMKQRASKSSEDDAKFRLEKEKNRLEKTINQLTQRLEYVEESLANL